MTTTALPLPILGIDLGTTFCCVSYFDAAGEAVIVPDLEGNLTTPSIVHFTGTTASFGSKAANRRHSLSNPVYQFFKRDMGKTAAELGGKYLVGGYDFQAAGLQALLLRYLRSGAVTHLTQKGLLSTDQAEAAALEAVITVPAYFGEAARRETRMAALAAGLRVAGIINEPTAAALAFGAGLEREQTLLVFDLGGGTFDVTIMRTGHGHANVLASEGVVELGGKDWDDLIAQYLKQEYRQRIGRPVPDTLLWQVQDWAVQAKLALTDAPHTQVRLALPPTPLDISLQREAVADFAFFDDAAVSPFVFEERSQNLLELCRTTLRNALAGAQLGWNDIDEIVLAGGSSRMPMVAKMLTREASRALTLVRPGFSYDTAISIGAARYAHARAAVTDVVARSLGIELVDDAGRPYVELLLKKNTPRPQAIFEDSFEADPNATLKVYEGESTQVRDYPAGPLGEVQLGNPAGPVLVRLEQDAGGLIVATVCYSDQTVRKSIEPYGTLLKLDELTTRIQRVQLDL